MAAVPGKQAAGQIVQLMNISGVRIFLQKAQKPFRKDPVAGHIGVVEKKQKVIEKIGNILSCVCGSGLSEALKKHLKDEKSSREGSFSTFFVKVIIRNGNDTHIETAGFGAERNFHKHW